MVCIKYSLDTNNVDLNLYCRIFQDDDVEVKKSRTDNAEKSCHSTHMFQGLDQIISIQLPNYTV